MMTDQPLDPAAIMAAHAEVVCDDGSNYCTGDHGELADWPCETHRLAAALAAAQEREQRVRAVVDGWTVNTGMANRVRAVLSGEGTADQPQAPPKAARAWWGDPSDPST